MFKRLSKYVQLPKELGIIEILKQIMISFQGNQDYKKQIFIKRARDLGIWQSKITNNSSPANSLMIAQGGR